MEYIAAIMAILQGLMSVAQQGAPLMQAIPGPIERQERKDVKADRERLSGGAGGMSEGKLDLAQQRAGGQIQSAYNQGMAQLLRGGAGQTGASGVQGQQVAQLMQGQAGALNQASAGVREMDLAEAARQRGELTQRQWALINQANARKAAYAGSGATTEQDRTMAGMMGREQLAGGISSLTDMFKAGGA